MPAEKRGIQNHAAEPYYVPWKIVNAMEVAVNDEHVPEANQHVQVLKSVDKRALSAVPQAFDDLGKLSGTAVPCEVDYELVPCNYDRRP